MPTGIVNLKSQAMSEKSNKFWPYQPKISIIASGVLLVGLLLILAALKNVIGWPFDESTNIVLIAVLLLSIMPVMLAILDIVIDRGGSLGYKDFKVDFAKVDSAKPAEITVPANIGTAGTPIYETNTGAILDGLQQAKQSNIVIVNIEDGKAWWETRLFVLLEGATRLGTPEKIVFVGNRHKTPQLFIGWAPAPVLFNAMLLKKPLFKPLYYNAVAAAKQWSLIEPLPPQSSEIKPPFSFGAVAGAPGSQRKAFDWATGMPGDFIQEEFLQNELSNKIENVTNDKEALYVTAGKVTDLFGDVLIENQIDQSCTKEEQARVFFANDAPYIVLTDNGKYLRLVSRLSVLNEILKNQQPLRKEDLK